MSLDMRIQIKNFLQKGSCLIVEPSSSFASTLQVLLSNYGVPLSQVRVARRFEDAKRIIMEQKPVFLMTEYDLNPGNGLTLIEMMESLYQDHQRVCLLVTKNSSDSVIAEASEGAVDGFILKPFSTEDLEGKLAIAFAKKTNPSIYQHKLATGQQSMLAGQLEESLGQFQAAKKLEEKPTMAYFFVGSVLQKMGKLEEALLEFRLGRKYQPLHYKCLIGEFEVLMILQRSAEAYSIIPMIRDNYPISANRLMQFFSVAASAEQYADLPKMFELYMGLETRPQQLTEIISSSFFSGGRFYLKKNEKENAMVFFNLSILSGARHLRLLEKIINELLATDALEEASVVLEKALPSDFGTALHTQLQFRIDHRLLPPEKLIDRGRKLVSEGHGTPEIYRILVPMLIGIGKDILAETIISYAAKEDPKLQKELYAMFPKK